MSPTVNGKRELSADTTVPVERLIVLDGELEGVKVVVLKDDGYNTNVVSNNFVSRHANLFNLRNCPMVVFHSKTDSTEKATSVIVQGMLKLGEHEYVSNCAVADFRYYVLLGMPWHVTHQPEVNYAGSIVAVDGALLPQAEICDGHDTG